ncbi:MAG: hypothetical protein ABW175_13605, partial [Bradyrhizobium sp.]
MVADVENGFPISTNEVPLKPRIYKNARLVIRSTQQKNGGERTRRSMLRCKPDRHRVAWLDGDLMIARAAIALAATFMLASASAAFAQQRELP